MQDTVDYDRILAVEGIELNKSPVFLILQHVFYVIDLQAVEFHTLYELLFCSYGCVNSGMYLYATDCLLLSKY